LALSEEKLDSYLPPHQLLDPKGDLRTNSEFILQTMEILSGVSYPDNRIPTIEELKKTN
jgi:hypothetical protein